jgi:hypothetical protein
VLDRQVLRGVRAGTVPVNVAVVPACTFAAPLAATETSVDALGLSAFPPASLHAASATASDVMTIN